MTPTTRTIRRARLATVLAAGLVLAGLSVPATALAAPPIRIAGDDRYATSAAVAETFALATDNRTTSVVLASGEEAGGGADALAANFLAGAAALPRAPVPVLLTERDRLPPVIEEALNSVFQGARDDGVARVTVYVVGGPNAISEQVIARLTTVLGSGADIQRIAGADRYETALDVTSTGRDLRNGATPTAYLAGGENPVDALSAAPATYAGPVPLLLTRRDTLDDKVLFDLTGEGRKNVVVLGGRAAVSDAVVAQLEAAGANVTRLGGADRFETNRLINIDAEARGIYFAPRRPYLANGLGFADALSAAPLAAAGSSVNGVGIFVGRQPLLLTSPSELSPPTAVYISENAEGIDAIRGVGGAAALPETLLARANSLAES